MSKPSEHLTFQYEELNKFNDQLRMMTQWGVLPTDPGFQRLLSARGAALGKLGFKLPRITSLIAKLIGLSPGEISLWADAEIGWLTEARAGPGAPPVRKHISDELAKTILQGDLTHELFETLLVPDVAIDN